MSVTNVYGDYQTIITGEETNLRYSRQFIAGLTETTFKQIG